MLYGMFKKQALSTPNNIAVKKEDEYLTYKSLDEKSTKLAEVLTNNLSRKIRVGIYSHSSINQVIAILAVLKSANSYVPLDPKLPSERLKYIVTDAQVEIVIVDKIIEAGYEINKPSIIYDYRRKDFDNIQSLKHFTKNIMDDEAYVIYTSGTTGQPKGIRISNNSITNHMLWFNRTFEMGSKDILLQKTPFSFDASIWEFLAPLTTGATLYLLDSSNSQYFNNIQDIIVKENITFLQVVPSVLNILLRQKGFDKCTSLKKVFCGGEILSIELQNLFFDILPATELYNLYGPAEATINTTYWKCRKNENIKRRSVPVGKPIDGVDLFVLDENMKKVSDNNKGELYISGVNLCLGYTNDDLNLKYFVSYKESDGDSERRLYKTGDFVRYIDDINLEFLGRKDEQINIHGLRIEPEEINAQILSFPNVKNSTVVQREIKGAKQIVSYIESRENIESELKKYLLLRLPNYMVPTIYVFIDKMPLMVNGKIDKKSLPEPSSHNLIDMSYESETEKKVLEIWQKFLKTSNIQRKDNFFAIGGNSLIGTKIIYELNKNFDCNLSIEDILINSTIELITKRISNRLGTNLDNNDMGIKKVERKRYYE